MRAAESGDKLPTMKRFTIIILGTLVLIGAAYGLVSTYGEVSDRRSSATRTPVAIVESGSLDASRNADYWLNSGAEAYESDGTLSTLSGELPDGSDWRDYYASTNPADTDGGRHPQSIFRLLAKRSAENVAAQAYFSIRRHILSESANRNESNGVFLMTRYRDGDNLYYAGLRVDGYAVVKKKLGGAYHTLATAPVFSYARYDRAAMPNLLPENVPLGVRAEVFDAGEGRVQINVLIDIGKNGTWVPVIRAVDAGSGAASGTPVIAGEGLVGIRTDFMEVDIEEFSVESL